MREAERDYGRLIDILEAADNILAFPRDTLWSNLTLTN